MSAIAKPSAGAMSFLTGTNHRATSTPTHPSQPAQAQVITPPAQPTVTAPTFAPPGAFTAPPPAMDRKPQTVVMPPARTVVAQSLSAVHPNNPLPPMQPDVGMAVLDKGTPVATTQSNASSFGAATGLPTGFPSQAPSFTPPVQQAAPVVTAAPVASTPAPLVDFASMTNGSYQTATPQPQSQPQQFQPSTFPVSTGQPPAQPQAAQFQTAQPIANSFATQAPAIQQPASTLPAEDLEEIRWSSALSASINSAINKISYDCGERLLEDRNLYDSTNKLHEAIWMMRWNSDGMVQMAPGQLCSYELVLTAHQVYVQAQENYWSQKYNFMGKEKDRLFREARGSVDAKTEKDKENLLIRTSPNHRNIFAEFRMAEAMHHYLKDFGARFAQLQNGLKRTIDLAIAERQTSIHQSRSSN